MSNNNNSLLVGLTILAVGGLGLFIYKSSNDTEDDDDDDGSDDSSSEEEEEEEEEEYKSPSKKQRAKTQRTTKGATKGTKRRY